MEVDSAVDALVEEFGAPPGLREAVLGLLELVQGPGSFVDDPSGTIDLEPSAVPPRAAERDTPDVAWTAPGTDPSARSGSTAAASSTSLPSRYDDLGPLGQGGMGEVRRVRDRVLGRVAALKILSAPLGAHPATVRRFVEEAQVAAQLQHPGLVPVYDAGRLADGRPWFTMKEVRGRSFSSVIREVHDASSDGTWRTGRSGWTLHRLVDAFAAVCDAVGYAHARGVLHRDLKPDNVLIGDHGEVLVIDWGLAKIVGRADVPVDEPVHPVDDGARPGTRVGTVSGTAAYMAPEQARGEIRLLNPSTDVYALGAILYEVLTGHAPYRGTSARDVLRQVVEGAPPPPPGGNVPEELQALWQRAMARDQAERFAHGAAVGELARSWLQGSRLRERALQVVLEAEQEGARSRLLRQQAAERRREGVALLARVKLWEGEERKAAGWASEDAAAELERAAELADLRNEQLMHGALQHVPALPEALAALAERSLAAHVAAEEVGDKAAATRAEVPMRTHAQRLPGGHPLRTRCLTYLVGDGALTLLTEPDPVEVELHRFEIRNRRLVALPFRLLGATPVVEVALPMGSYLCVLRHAHRPAVRYPVHIARGEQWTGVPPDERAPRPIRIPTREELGDDVYLPAGWCRVGDRRIADSPVQRVWCDGLIARRFPVTTAEYVAFLDDLVATGRESDAVRWAPRETSSAVDGGAMVLDRDLEGRFVPRVVEGVAEWRWDWPIAQIDAHGAEAFAAWWSGRTGARWRLPGELEWEKAARGVDGRHYPWGDAYDPSWACNRDSHPARPWRATVTSYPVDESVYGVRGCAGNVREWCIDHYDRSGPSVVGSRPVVRASDVGPDPARVVRGGGWGNTAAQARAANRGRVTETVRNSDLGFRLVRSFP